MTVSRLFLYGAFLCLIACGGGGSGGGGSDGRYGTDDDDDHDSFDPPVDNAVPLEYEGAKGAAGLGPENIGYFISSTLSETKGSSYLEDATSSGSDDDTNFSIAAAPNTTSPGLTVSKSFRPKALTFNILSSKKPRSDAADNAGFGIAAVSDSYDHADQYSVDCESGSIDYFVMRNDDGTGKIMMDNKNCLEEGVITDGLMTQDIHEYDTADFTIEHATLSFRRVTTTIGELNFIQSGSFEYELLAEDHERRITDIVYTETNSGAMGWLRNMVLDVQYEDFFGSSNYSESISGRFYDGWYGYVDIETIQPIEYSHNIPTDGELTITGAGGSNARLEFPGGIGFTLNLDVDGNEVYENTATLSLAGLSVEQNADVRDDDGDGMHNSWEAFHGLDPSSPDDADLDTDEDSVSNRDEYRLGYVPDDNESVPPFSDIELSTSQFNDQLYPAGHASSFTFLLDNDGTDDADSVSVRFTMPPGFSLQSVTQFPSEFEGDCEIELNIARCQFTDVGPNPARHVQINFILPGTTGIYSYEAAVVHSSLFDVDESNNAVSGQIEVRPATAELATRFLVTPQPVPTTHNFSYVFEIENTGALVAASVRAELELPEGVSLIESTLGGCLLTDGTVVCSYPELYPGQRREESVAMTPLELGSFEATLTVTSDTPELNSADNMAAQTWDVITPVADMYMNFLSHETAQLALTNAEWGLSIFTHNDGPHLMPEAQITIDLPPEIEVVRLEDAESAECVGAHPAVCTVTEVAPGANTYFNFKIFFSSSVPGIYEFPVTITAGGDDPDLSNNTQMILTYIGAPVDSIQAQIDAATDGDTIEVPASYYLGNLNYSKSINLVATEGPENTFWAAEFSGGLDISDAAGGEVTGFTFAYGRAAIRLFNSGVNVHDNIFEKLRGDPAMNVIGLAGAVIERNIFKGNSSCFFGVISLFDQTDPIIRNNFFLDNPCGAIVLSTPGSPSVIVNNHFIGNTKGIVISAADRDAGAYIGNNIFYGNMVGIETITDCGSDCPTFQSNLFYDNSVNYEDSPDQVGVNGNISVGPLFTDAANGDYTLQSGSPAIDAGDSLHAPADDFAGDARPVDGDGSTTAEPDIGAYEFQPPD